MNSILMCLANLIQYFGDEMINRVTKWIQFLASYMIVDRLSCFQATLMTLSRMNLKQVNIKIAQIYIRLDYLVEVILWIIPFSKLYNFSFQNR